LPCMPRRLNSSQRTDICRRLDVDDAYTLPIESR
jgi:hypothetical protein